MLVANGLGPNGIGSTGEERQCGERLEAGDHGLVVGVKSVCLLILGLEECKASQCNREIEKKISESTAAVDSQNSFITTNGSKGI